MRLGARCRLLWQNKYPIDLAFKLTKVCSLQCGPHVSLSNSNKKFLNKSLLIHQRNNLTCHCSFLSTHRPFHVSFCSTQIQKTCLDFILKAETNILNNSISYKHFICICIELFTYHFGCIIDNHKLSSQNYQHADKLECDLATYTTSP